MFRYLSHKILLAAVLSISMTINAQKINEPRTTAESTAPYQPFRIAGNLYYVGTQLVCCRRNKGILHQ